jgi:hypothetical protein
MRRSLMAMSAVLLSGVIGGANETPPIVQEVIHATSVRVKKAALEMFVPDGYTIDSETAPQLKISQPFSSEETNAYNTAHWTNPPVANCRHVRSFLLSPVDHAINVTMAWETVCHTDGSWLIRRTTNEKEIQTMQTTLANLKAKTEEAAKGH